MSALVGPSQPSAQQNIHGECDDLFWNASQMTLESSGGVHSNGVDETTESNSQIMDACIRTAIRHYLRDMGDHDPENIYKLFLLQFERPLLEEVLNWCDDNQTRASRVLGLNRGTLRKKLAQIGDNQNID